MIGRMLGHYRVLEPIDSGGMGVVYRARDERLERDVALKVLPEGAVAEPTARARLLREARTASSLNHPHVCTIHEVAEEGGQVFVAMELVEGRSLRELIGAGGLPSATVIRYGIQIADALAHAHERGVVHRDLKSANVMITREGRVKVLDFGLARRATGGSAPVGATRGLSLTETGAIVGTPHYLSPEVLHGADADYRSDIWALGVMLHEMAAGTLPFEGQTTFELGAAIMQAPPAPLPASVPAGLRAVVARCLEKEPAHRYARAGEVQAALEAIHSGAAPVPTPATPASSGTIWPQPWQGAIARVPVWAFAVAALLGVMAIAWVLNLGSPRERVVGGEPGPASALAVLPLTDLSGQSGQEYFADGMTDELITSLGKISALTVIARSSVMGYKGTREPLPKVARALGVGSLLEGTVLRSGDRVRISVQLIRAATGKLVWSESYERSLSDVLALQSEVALAIAREIQVKLTPQEQARLASSRVVDPRAHEAYLLGRQQWNTLTYNGELAAIANFRRAIQIDPGYAQAYTGLADAFYTLSNWYVRPDSAMPLIRDAARKALELDPNLAEAHAFMALTHAVYEWDFKGGEVEFRRAIELNASSSNARLYYGYFLVDMGRFDQAREQLARAVELDPLNTWARWLATWPAFYERRYDRAIEELTRLVELDPQSWSAYSLMGEAYEQKKDYPSALDRLRKARALGGNIWVHTALARTFAKAGQRDSAQRVLRDLDAMSAGFYITPYGVATVHAALGDHERALGLLERAERERSEDLMFIRMDPRVDRLRTEPRFIALMRRMGFAS